MKRSRSTITLSAASAVLLTLSFAAPVGAVERVTDKTIATIEASTPAVEVVDPQPSGSDSLPAAQTSEEVVDIGVAAGQATTLDVSPRRGDARPRKARVVATAAAATPTTAGAIASTNAVAPNCVSFSVNQWTGAITVYNNCPYYVRVKIVIRFGPDSSCWGINAGASKTGRFIATRVDRLEAC